MATVEHPILFSGEMVKAILAGKKTQTRRVIKAPFPFLNGYYTNWSDDADVWYPTTPSGKIGLAKPIWCPYGKIGDHLWVRETFSRVDKGNFTIFKADGLTAEEYGYDKITWKPSIFMPRRASRITLEVTDIRVERVQDISQEDIESEGIQFVDGYLSELCVLRDCVAGIRSTRIKFYKNLWDKINGKRGFGWDVNPWVWVVSFKRIKP